MGKYIKLFKDNLERGTYEGSVDYIEPYVSYVEDDESVHYNISDIFCKLYLDDNTVVNIEGEGLLTHEHVADYIGNIVKVELGKKCTELQGYDGTTDPVTTATFSGCPKLKEVYISTSLETIPDRAFAGCTNLELISIPYSVTIIDASAFASCNNLKSVILPKNLTAIGDNAFVQCTSLKTVSGNTHLTTIGNNAFNGCMSLESIELGDSVETIGTNAFLNCGNLTNINLPNTVTSIGPAAFSQSGLTSIKIPDNVVAIPASMCYNCFQLETIEFGKNNAVINTNAFSACPQLKDIVIPNSVTTLRGSAFSGSGCNSITIPNSVTTIEGGALAFTNIKEMYYDSPVELNATLRGGYGGLEKVVIGDTTTTITSSAFASTPVKEITIGKNVTAITNNAFAGCQRLEKLVIPDNVEDLTGGPFSGCTKLKELTLGKGITAMNSGTFSSAPLEKVKYTGTIEEFTSINDYHFWTSSMLITVIHCSDGDYIIPFSYKLTLVDGTIKLEYNNNTLPPLSGYKNTLVTLETGPICTQMAAQACYECSVLETVKLDDNTQIGVGAFQASSIRSITFGKNITTIPQNAFNACPNINNVIIPDSVTQIQSQAFYYCTALHNITLSNNLTVIGNSAFSNTNLDKIVLPQSLTTIDNYAFGYTKLKEVTLPKNITNLGTNVFVNCNQLETFIIQSTYLIEYTGYTDASNLRHRLGDVCNLIIDCNPTKLGAYILAHANITNITIPNSVTEIGDCAFYGCNNLTKVKLSANLVTVGNRAFHQTKLDKLRLPNNITSIGNGAFRENLITVIDIPDKVQYIGQYTFAYCNLKKVIIGKSVTSIGGYAFANSSIKPLEEIILKPTVPPALESGVFTVSSATVIYVPKESVDAYKSSPYWSSYVSYIKPSK